MSSSEQLKKFANERLLIVGNPDPVHVGAHLFNAAQASRLSVKLCDSNSADGSSWLTNKLNWWLRGHRPSRLEVFSEEVVEVCRQFNPRWLLTTGLSPVTHSALQKIGRLGVRRLNFLTDDPWNPAHKASWFMKTLPMYDHVFSPRRANLPDLAEADCQKVSYVPFAYAPELHFPEPLTTTDEKERFASDVVFAGGADPDRVRYFEALMNADFDVTLYGGYWQRFQPTKARARGHADPPTVRKAIAGSKIALCLVRRANRDGHAMRSYEVPAMGGCMLAEDTAEHRQIFGGEGESVLYFSSITEMINKAHWLRENANERSRLAKCAHNLILSNGNSYADRLAAMLSNSNNGSSSAECRT